MATIRENSTVTISPVPGPSNTVAGAQQQAAGVEAGAAQAETRLYGEAGAIATSYLRDTALRQAQADAAQIVRYDEQGKLIVPEGFDAPGVGGLIYGDTYWQAAVAYYRSAALTEAQAFASDTLSKNPTDPAAAHTVFKIYADAKLEAIRAVDGSVADTLAPQLEGVRAGVVSSAQAARQRETFAVMSDQADRAAMSYATELAAALREFDRSNAPVEVRAKTLDAFASRWADVATLMRNAGRTEATIAAAKDRYQKVAEGNAVGMILQERASGAAFDPVAIQQLRQQALEWARQPSNAPFQAELMPILGGYINRGAAMAGAVQEADNIAQQNRMGTIAVQSAQIQRDLLEGRITKEQADAAATRIYSDAMTQGAGLRPMQQAQLLGAAQAPFAYVQQAYAAAMTQAVNVAQHGETPAVRAQAVQDIQTFVNDPRIANYASASPQMAGLVVAGHRTLAEVRGQAMAYDVGTAQSYIASGELSPQLMPGFIDKARQNNLIGNAPGQMSAQQVAQAVAVGTTNWNTRQAARSNAATAIAQANPTDPAAKPVVPSGEAAEAVRAKVPFAITAKAPDGMQRQVPFDMMDADHRQRFLTYFNHTLVMPRQVQQAIAGVENYDPPERKAAALQLSNGMRNVLRSRMDGKMAAEDLDGWVYGQMQTMLGGAFAKTMAWTAGGPETDAKGTQQAVALETGARSQGDLDAASPAGIVAKFMGMSRDALQSGTFMSFTETNRDFLAPAFRATVKGLDFVIGPETRARFAAFRNETSRALIQPMLARSGLEGETIDGEKLSINGSALGILVSQVNKYMRAHGARDRDNGMDPEEQGILQALRDGGENFGVSRVHDRFGNVTGHEIVYRPAVAEFNKANATNFSATEVNGFYAAKAWRDRPGVMAMVDPATVRVRTLTGPDGGTTYMLSGVDKDHQMAIDIMPVELRGRDVESERIRLGDAIDKELNTGLGRALAAIPGGDLFLNGLAADKRKALIDLAAGKHMPTETWTAIVRDLRDRVMGSFNGDKSLADADWNTWETAKAQETIARMGSFHYLLFGNSATDFLLFRRQGGVPRPEGGQGLMQPGDAEAVQGAIEAEQAAEARRALGEGAQARRNRRNR